MASANQAIHSADAYADSRSPSLEQPGSTQQPTGGARSLGSRLLLAVLAALMLAAGVVAYRLVGGRRELPLGLIQVSGRIEGDSSTLASKLAGRVQAVAVREGDSVSPGQTLIRLEDSAVRARLAQAVAAAELAAASLEAARAELTALQRELPLQRTAAEAARAAADARLTQAHATQEQAQRENERVHRLFDAHTLDTNTWERAVLALTTANQDLVASEAARLNAEQTVAEARLGSIRLRAKAAELSGLEAASRRAQALRDEAASALADMSIVSPIAGTVTTRFVDLGEVVNAGTPLLEVVDLDGLYLKAFVPETDVGKVRLGVPARIYTDAFPNQSFACELRYIAARAEFTPKEVQTRDERVKLVYAVKLYVRDNKARRLTPGLSADAVIRWRKDVPWARPRW